MARLPLTIKSDDDHHLFELFARDMAAELADTLIDQNVAKATAHETVATFLFRYAMMFDGGGRYKTDTKYQPKVCFSNGLGELIVPTEDTHLHELAYDIVEAVYNTEGRR